VRRCERTPTSSHDCRLDSPHQRLDMSSEGFRPPYCCASAPVGPLNISMSSRQHTTFLYSSFAGLGLRFSRFAWRSQFYTVETSDPHLDCDPAQFDRRHLFKRLLRLLVPFSESYKRFVERTPAVGNYPASWRHIRESRTRLLISLWIHLAPGQRFSPATERPDSVDDPSNGNPDVRSMAQQKCVRGVPNGQIRVGNSPRGAILGPGLQPLDLSLFKNTNINERLRSN
jgi:hypothetical protein